MNAPRNVPLKGLPALTALLLCAAALAQSAPASDPAKVLQLVTFNDVYQIQPVDGGLAGGAARAAWEVQQLRAQNPNTLVLFAGDLLSPSVMSGIFKGQQMVDAMNSVGVNYATLGNHEMDFGLDTLKTRLGESKFKWLSANIIENATQKAIPGTLPDDIVTVGSVKVGLFGLAYDFKAILADKTSLNFLDPIGTAQAEVKSLRDRGAQFVIALTHEDAADDCALSAQVSGIDFIVGGHDHSMMSNTMCGHAPYVKATSDLRNLWAITVDLNSPKNPVYTYRNLPISAALPEDPQTAALVAGYANKLGADFAQVVGQTSVPLDARENTARGSESNLGDFIADSIRAATHADVAVMNGGGIRTDMLYPAGPLTKKDVYSILPFGNTVVVVKVPGSALRAALENSVSQVENGAGRFLQISGATYSFDPKAPSGKRIVSATVGGKPLDDSATYTVAINDYMYAGGDGYSMFMGVPVVVGPSEGPLISVVVANAVSQAGTIAPQLDGRISIKR